MQESVDDSEHLLQPAHHGINGGLELVLAPGRSPGDARLEMPPCQLVQVQLWEIGGRKNCAIAPAWISTKWHTNGALCCGCPLTMRKALRLIPLISRLRLSRNALA